MGEPEPMEASLADAGEQFGNEAAALKIQSLQRALAARELIEMLDAETKASDANTAEATLEFKDTDGDVVMLKREGNRITEYVNGKLEIENLEWFEINKEARTYQDSTGSGRFDGSEDLDKLIR